MNDNEEYSYHLCHKLLNDLYELGIDWCLARHADTFLVGPHADVKLSRTHAVQGVHTASTITIMSSWLTGYVRGFTDKRAK